MPFRHLLGPWSGARTAQALWTRFGALAACLSAATPAPAENIVYPAGAGVFNVRDARFGARGDGKTDDTAAIRKALAEGLWQHRVVYLPRGTYLVSDTLRWNDGRQNNTRGWGPWLQLQGQSRTGTVIKLKDRAPGFGDAGAPRPVVQTGSGGSHGNKQYTEGEGNEAFENHIRNLTVDVGAGNPGAVGIDYQASNVGAMRHVSIRSSDPRGAGYCGVSLTRRDNGPGLLKDVSVDGFRFGVRTGQEIAQFVLEDVTLAGQGEAGVWVRDSVLAVRKLTSRNSVPAVRVSGVALLVLLDSQLLGGAGGGAAAVEAEGNEARLFLRRLRTQGYAASVTSRGQADKRTAIRQWLSDAPFGPSARAGAAPPPLDLPVRETPVFEDSNPRNWADAGAPSGSDDTRAVQAAMDSGKATVYFRHGTYRLRDTITVPAHVRRVLGVGTQLDAPERLPGGRPMFRVAGGTAKGLTIFDRFTCGARGGFLVEHASPRAVVLRDILPFDAMVYRNRAGAGPLFIEDVSGAGYRFDHPTRVWARQWNFEGAGEPKVVNNGATIWALGWKHEGHETLIENRSGGRMELLGGFAYTFGVDPQKPAFVNEDASLALSFAGTTYAGEAGFFRVLVRDTRGGRTREFRRADAFGRGAAASVPLYVSVTPSPPRPAP
uniref:GH55 n=1 Tax=uncultured Armatimonadetes bacterium TaxID=157466 RepID=A0A6J4IG57_9BACT|nr:GH55 [uncultured Armatimonadetes bacterium]